MRYDINMELPFIAKCSAEEWKLLFMLVALMDDRNYVVCRPVGYSDYTFKKILTGLAEKNLIHRNQGTIQVNKMFARSLDVPKRIRGRVG